MKFLRVTGASRLIRILGAREEAVGAVVDAVATV